VDIDGELARKFAAEMSAELGIPISAGTDARAAARQSDIVVTCTPSKRAILGPDDIAPGAFVAAVGADSETKQELEPALMAQCTVVADILDQCAAFGDLHHAIEAGAMRREDVYAELADVVSGKKPGRRRDDERIIFDSTGTAIEDVAAAAVVYRRAIQQQQQG
jgi:ornithine cyclodeaminase/alanine dehydrogenase-like protein (mu-crystallin family)